MSLSRALRKKPSPPPEKVRRASQKVAGANCSWRLQIIFALRGRDKRRRGIWQRRIFNFVSLNVQIARAAFGDFAENRTANLSAVIAFLRFVHYDGNANLRIVRRKKSDEGRNKFVGRVSAV